MEVVGLIQLKQLEMILLQTKGETDDNNEESDENRPNQNDNNEESASNNSYGDTIGSINSNIVLSSLSYIVRGLQSLPGRKSVMFLSDGLAFPTITQLRDDPKASQFAKDIQKLTELATRSSVVFYTMETRGLQTGALTAADNVSNRSPQEIRQILSSRRSFISRGQEGLRYLSGKTGGIAVVNSNDLNGGMRKLINDQSYYLIGYQPDSDTFSPKENRFNKLEVKVKRKDVKVRYRSGFFGISNENINFKKEPKNFTPEQKISNALASPFATNEIDLRLNTLFKGDEKNNWFLDSFIYVKTKDLKFIDDKDGTKKVKFDIVAMNFGENGVPTDEFGKTHTINLGKKTYERIRDKGFVYFFRFPVKKAGGYQMRVVIRDYATQKVGSASQFVSIPKLNKKRLMLSGIGLENLTYKQWQEKLQTKETNTPNNAKTSQFQTNARSDTSLRKFHRGTVLQYGLEVYNSKSKNNQRPSLEMQTRVFYNGKIIYEGKKRIYKHTTTKP